MKKKKSLFEYSNGFSGLSVAEISGIQTKSMKESKKSRRRHTFEKEGLTSRESRVSIQCPFCSSESFCRNGKTRQGIQRYRCGKCGRTFVIAGGKNLFSAKLTADELLRLFSCIYLELPIHSICRLTGLSPKTVVLWQKRAFYVAKEWIDSAAFEGKTWIDEVYFNFSGSNGKLIGSEVHKKAGLSFGNVCVCIAYDEKGTMFCRVVKAGKVDALSVECCFSGRMNGVSLLVHDAEKAHRTLIKAQKLKDKVVKSTPKTAESLKAMEPINNYSALLVNEMRKHPGTKISHLDERLCFISYKAWLNKRYGEELGIQILLSEVVKNEKKVFFKKKRKKSKGQGKS